MHKKLRLKMSLMFMALLFTCLGFFVSSVKNVYAIELSNGDLIKTDGSSLYQLNNNRRDVIPDSAGYGAYKEAVMSSRGLSESSVKTIQISELTSYAIGKNLTIKPNTNYLLKKQNQERYFIVSEEEVVTEVSKSDYSSYSVVTIPDIFLSNYTISNETKLTGYTLNVSKTGTGAGIVFEGSTVETGSEINCGSKCSASFISNTPITLTAIPSEGSVFTSWTGCGSNTTNPICNLQMTENKNIVANFSIKSTPSSVIIPTMIYPMEGESGVPVNTTLKWQLKEFTGKGTCRISLNTDWSDVAKISADIPCFSGLNTYSVTLKPGMTYWFEVSVLINGNFDKLSYTSGKFYTSKEDVNNILGDFTLVSPKIDEETSGKTKISWTVPSNSSVSNVDMTICYADNPMSPLPVKRSFKCKTGEICSYEGDFSSSWYKNDTTIYWHVVAGDVCWKDIKVKGQFIVKVKPNKSVNNQSASNNSDNTLVLKLQRRISELENEVIELEKKATQLDQNFANKYAGTMFLDVENQGRLWYVDPASKNRFYFENGESALSIGSKLATGISYEDIQKIPVGVPDKLYNLVDSDKDGLPDNLEVALGLDPYKADTDGDGYSDKVELNNGYNPIGNTRYLHDKKLTDRLEGKMLLQVAGPNSHGEIWYVSKGKRWYGGTQDSMYEIMKAMSLGAVAENIRKIEVGGVSGIE